MPKKRIFGSPDIKTYGGHKYTKALGTSSKKDAKEQQLKYKSHGYNARVHCQKLLPHRGISGSNYYAVYIRRAKR